MCLVCFDYCLLVCLDNNNNNKDGCDGYFLHANPLEYIPWETLGGKFLFRYGYMQKIGLCETYDHFCYYHNYKNQMIYHDHLDDGREKFWSDT